jgi:hypothetical protein
VLVSVRGAAQCRCMPVNSDVRARMRDRTAALGKQIDDLLALFPEVKQSWYSGNMGGHFRKTVEYERLITQAISLVKHIYGNTHPHTQRCIHFVNGESLHSVQQLEGLLLGAKVDLANGMLEDLTSRIVLDIKSDFLESAQTLADEGQKDPAAVLACVVLEDSLKRLAAKHGIENAGDKEMSVVASLLLSERVIEKSTNQAIQSFRNLRNAALHAQWSEVSIESVRLLLAFLPSFVEKHGI